MNPEFERFRDEVARHVPGFPPSASATFDITRHGPLDHVQRVALRSLILDSVEGLDPMALEPVLDLGALWQLVADHSGRRGPDAISPSGRSRTDWSTSRVRLAPIEPAHIGPLYLAATHPADGYRWRWRGRTPSAEEFHQTLFAGVKSQFVVEEQGSGRLVGMVVAYDEDLACRHCQVGFIRAAGNDVVPGGMVEGMAVFLDFLFHSFPYERIIFDVPEFNLPLLAACIDALITPDGSIPAFYFHGGRSWDRCFMSIWRHDWQPIGEALFGRAVVDDRVSPPRPPVAASAGTV